jgi:hypothetical protein
VIEDAVVFATGHEGEAGQVGEHRACAILSKDMEQGTRRWELVRGEIARDRRECLAQFRWGASVASVPKTAEPVVTMRLRNHRARADDLPALASGVASSTDVIQPPKRRGQVVCLW